MSVLWDAHGPGRRAVRHRGQDGGKSADYCKYCYDKGAFTFHGTMEEMIEICVPPMVQSNQGMTPEQAREMMRQFFPHLKRWK